MTIPAATRWKKIENKATYLGIFCLGVNILYQFTQNKSPTETKNHEINDCPSDDFSTNILMKWPIVEISNTSADAIGLCFHISLLLKNDFILNLFTSSLFEFLVILSSIKSYEIGCGAL